MSLPGIPHPAKPADERLALLRGKGRCVDIADVGSGDVLHTGFGYGPEFWQLPEGIRATAVAIDHERAEVVDARLITTKDTPLTAPDALVARGIPIIRRIPQI